MEANLGWLFYRDYFSEYFTSESQRNKESIQRKSEALLKYKCELKKEEKLGNFEINFKTTYPGLLIGSGYAHELKEIEGQLSLGFYFDYTSGLPTIPASSIKGVLRSAFKYPEYIKKILNHEFEKSSGMLEELIKEIKDLETEIFEGKDIFFDAFITKESDNKEFLSDDYITPHSNPIKNPVPIRFLKIKPEISFSFQFKLSDGLITKYEKLKLFKEILSDFGIGAKTNIGYGQLNFKGDFDEYLNKIKNQENDIIKKTEELKKKEEEESKLDPIDLEIKRIIDGIIDEYKTPAFIIQEMKKRQENDPSSFENIKEKLAKKVKIMIQNEKAWDNPKKKEISRKEYILSCLP